MKKRILSMMLVLCMVLGMMPVSAFAAETDNLCDHHTEHTADCGYAPVVEGSPCTHECGEECAEACAHTHDALCGYVEAVAEVPCGYVCEESHEEEPSDEPAEEPVEEPAPVCDCGTDDGLIHATTCAVYVAPENPVCYCTEKCTEVNVWCDVCGFDYTACTGTDTAATCIAQAVCSVCGESYGELGAHTAEPTYVPNAGDSTQHDATYSCCGATVTEAHTMNVTTGKCDECGADMTVVATVTDGTNTYYAADAATLNQAVTAILETGSRTFTVELPADAEAGMIIAIRRAICDTEGVADGSIHLTLKGVTSIPGTTNWDGVAFGPGDIYDEAGKIVDQELVTQLASINLPDVTEIGAQAFYCCENLVSVSAPKAQTIGAQALGYTALTSVEFPELTTIPTDMFSGTWTLSSAKFPKVTTIEQGGLLVGAKFKPENNPTPFPLELTAEGDITFNGSNHFNIKSQNYSGKVDLVLCCDKADKVTKNEDGTATWQVRDDLSYTFKSITFTCTDGTTNHSYTYTDNGDGTHKATCNECGYEETSRPHTIENHACTDCGAMEIVVSFNAGDYEWKTGDTLYFCRVSRENEWEEYCFTATVAEDGTVTWTPDKTLYWDDTGKHKLVVVYPGDTPWAWDRFYVGDDQTTTEKLHEFDLMNAMWSGNPTTDPITLNLKHRLAKVTVNYEIAEGVTVSKAEVYTLTQYLLFDIHTLERKNIAWEEGHDLWINSYHNGNQFTAFVSPDAYAADGNFIKITLSDGSVREVKMNKAVTFEEGAEYTYKVVITADGAYLTCADECSFEYTANEDGLTHSKTCSKCGYVAASETHSGGTATCTEQAECQHCGASYGEVNANNHNWENGVCTYECGTTHDPHTFENGICTVCGMAEGPVELAITQQPTDSSAKLGETYCVEVIAVGEGLTYQWYFRNAGTNTWHKSSVTDNTYDDVMTTARAGREVYCVITDADGNSVTTDTAKLIAVKTAELAITQQPNDASAKLGELFNVEVLAEGDGLKYQWYWRQIGAENWTVSGQRDNTYDDVMTSARHNREVYCVITDAWGNSVTTEIATITGTPTTTLAITRQPENQTVTIGDMFNVTFEAQGDGLKYQWYFRQAGTEVWYTSGQRDNSYDDVMTKARHNRELYCVVTDAWGNTVETDPIVVILATPRYELAITAQPENESVKMGEMFCVTVEAQGDELKYQWYWRNVGSENWNVSGQRDNTYDDVMTKARHNREVKCVITDMWGESVETNVVTITAIPDQVLAIVAQPTDATAAMGEKYCVTVEAQGDGLTYQWYFKNAGTDVWHVSGVKDNTYDDVMIESRAGRQVYCVITDKYGNQVVTEVVTIHLEK